MDTAYLRELIDRVNARWRDDARVTAPASLEQIELVERELNVSMPPALRELWLRSNGAQMDGETCIAFWSLAEVVAERSVADWNCPPGYLCFADFLIHSHAYAVRADGGGDDVLLVCSGAPERVAESMAAFLESFLTDARLLHGAQEASGTGDAPS